MDDPDPTAITVELSDTQRHLRVDPRRLADRARRALAMEGVARAELSVALVDDPTIRLWNRRHLGHDRPTDVISFPMSDAGGPVLAGSVVVSAETAARVAAERGIDPGDELTLYLVHGLLHLCGYDDLTAGEAGRMRRREREILVALGLAPPSRDDDGAGAEDAGMEAGRCLP